MRKSKFELIDSDVCYRTYLREIVGRITYKRHKLLQRYSRMKSWRNSCGCEHDCCGCVFSERMEIQTTSEGFKIYFTQSLNY